MALLYLRSPSNRSSVCWCKYWFVKTLWILPFDLSVSTTQWWRPIWKYLEGNYEKNKFEDEHATEMTWRWFLSQPKTFFFLKSPDTRIGKYPNCKKNEASETKIFKNQENARNCRSFKCWNNQFISIVILSVSRIQLRSYHSLTWRNHHTHSIFCW